MRDETMNAEILRKIKHRPAMVEITITCEERLKLSSFSSSRKFETIGFNAVDDVTPCNASEPITPIRPTPTKSSPPRKTWITITAKTFFRSVDERTETDL